MPILVETVDEFRERHGDSVYDGRREIFEDGAVIEHEGRSRREPPTDEAGLRMVRTYYTQAKVERLVSNFNRLRENVKTQSDFHAAKAGPPPHPQALQVLRQLADEIIEWKLRLEEMEKRSPSGVREQQHKQIESVEQHESQATLDELRNLPVF